jgi:hypothetical protein
VICLSLKFPFIVVAASREVSRGCIPGIALVRETGGFVRVCGAVEIS